MVKLYALIVLGMVASNMDIVSPALYVITVMVAFIIDKIWEEICK